MGPEDQRLLLQVLLIVVIQFLAYFWKSVNFLQYSVTSWLVKASISVLKKSKEIILVINFLKIAFYIFLFNTEISIVIICKKVLLQLRIFSSFQRTSASDTEGDWNVSFMKKQVLITWEYGNSSSLEDSILKITYKPTSVKKILWNDFWWTAFQ